MFTDRFITIPTEIYNTKQAELTGKEEYYESISKINPLEICEYYESESDGKEVVQIYLKNGRTFCANITFDEFENILNSWQNRNQ